MRINEEIPTTKVLICYMVQFDTETDQNLTIACL